MNLRTNIKCFFQQKLRLFWRLLGYGKAIRHRSTGVSKVLIIGGFGYGNTGDEAQLGANLQLWKTTVPLTNITILSPNPAYTFQQHGVASEFASRIIFFKAHADSHYGDSDSTFKRRFWLVWIRMILNAHLMRAGIAPIFASAEEASLLTQLHCANILHISGGGFLTGMTRSRLWDSSLIMILCQYLGTPYFLTGHTIGIFQSNTDRWLARKALLGALTISLRDPEQSKQELIQLGVAKEKLISSVDDALFCEKSDVNFTKQALLDSGLDPEKNYICVNYHFWGMSEDTKKKSIQRLAYLLDKWIEKIHIQVLFVPMYKSDETAEKTVICAMKQTAHLLRYSYEYQIARGVISNAECLISFKHHPLIFALGEGVPAMSISLDEYYWRKNDGAMRNFNQHAFCIHGNDFYKETADILFNNLYSNRISIKLDIQEKSQEYYLNRRNIFDCTVNQLTLKQ